MEMSDWWWLWLSFLVPVGMSIMLVYALKKSKQIEKENKMITEQRDKRLGIYSDE
jgi:hypothetical protein